MSIESQWRSTRKHTDLAQRVVVRPQSLTWHQTDYPGIRFGCFESNPDLQDHPVTMLTQFEPGGFFPRHGHPGGEEVLVLEGQFEDETGVHGPGTFMLNPEGFNHRPYSAKGCLTFVKLRQHGGETRKQIKTNIFQADWQPTAHPRISRQFLYEQPNYTEKVWTERWDACTHLTTVTESLVKEIYIVKGNYGDAQGSYPQGTWLRYPPHLPYQPFSESGCLLYIKTYPAAYSPRFIVGGDFHHPLETL
ncbi:MAG: cupin domain-containing protein, partial [Cyanobacteria bacterium P01_H01_bin.15]